MSEKNLEVTGPIQTKETAQENIIFPELVDDYLQTEIGYILSKILPPETSYYDTIGIAETSTNKILGILEEKNISQITSIKQIGYHVSISYINNNNEKAYIAFDLRPQTEEGYNYISEKTPSELESMEARKKQILRKENESLSRMISAMESIFTENGKEFWGELGDEDILKTSEFDTPDIQLQGKTIKEIQELTSLKIAEIKLMRIAIFDSEIPSDKLIQENFETYLGYIIGVGLGNARDDADHYESGAEHFDKSRKEVDFLIDELVNNSQSMSDLFHKMREIHRQIDDNNYQTTTVEKSYKYFSETLNQSVLARLKKNYPESATKEDFLCYIQFVSGRDFTLDGKTYSENMDSRLYSPEMANKALLAYMTLPQGMMEGILEHIDLEDPLVGNKTGKALYSEAAELLSSSVKGENGESIDGKKLLANMNGFQKFESNETPYAELPYSDKIIVSTLARLVQKLRPIHVSSGPRYNHTTEKRFKSFTLPELVGVFQEISQDAIGDITEEISSGTDWSWGDWDGLTSEEIGLTGTDAEIYNLFRDINGSGAFMAFELSDDSVDLLKDAAMMAAVVVGAIIIGSVIIATLPASGAMIAGVNGALVGTVAGSNLLVQGGIYGVSASMASWGLDYAVGDAKGYGNSLEAATNISTDILVGGITGVAGGYLMSRFGIEGAKLLSGGNAKNTSIFAGDLAFLGIGPEMGRMYIMDEIFHSTPPIK